MIIYDDVLVYFILSTCAEDAQDPYEIEYSTTATTEIGHVNSLLATATEHPAQVSFNISCQS